MYCPIDKTKLMWLCFTLVFLFIVVIRLPIALLSKKQPKSDKCLRDDGCFNSRLRSSKKIENLSLREYELQQIFHDTTDSSINPRSGRPNETVTSSQNVDIPITSMKTTSIHANEPASQPDSPTSQTPCLSSACDRSLRVAAHCNDPLNTTIIA